LKRAGVDRRGIDAFRRMERGGSMGVTKG